MMRIAPAVDDPIVDEAIGWLLLLQSNAVTEADQRKFSQWRLADPRHEAAYARLRTAVGGLSAPVRQGLPSEDVRRVLRAPSASRRKALNRLAALAGIGVLTKGTATYLDLDADLRTATAERRVWTLADGSKVTLNARSAVSIAFDGAQRSLHLRSGEILAAVSRDVVRPFIVITRFGSVRASDAVFSVRLADDDARVTLQQSNALVTAASNQVRQVEAGQTAIFDAQGVREPSIASGAEAAWSDGNFVIYDGVLSDVVEALRPYRAGFIRISPQAARLRVTGAFPLDDTDRALTAIAQALPVKVERYTPRWVMIDTI